MTHTELFSLHRWKCGDASIQHLKLKVGSSGIPLTHHLEEGLEEADTLKEDLVSS